MSARMLDIDVLLLVIGYLGAEDIASLASTCRHFYRVVHDFGWSTFLRNNQRYSLTLCCSRSRWSAFAQARYDAFADRAWSRASFIARPLARPWQGNLQPAIALSTSTLLVAAGHVLHSFSIRDTLDALPSRIAFERSYAFTLGPAAVQRDITSVAFHPDPARDRTVLLGFEDGSVEQVCLPPLRRSRDGHYVKIARTSCTVLHRHGSNVIQNISCTAHTILSLAQSGSVSLTSLASDSSSSASINLGARSWTSHLCMTSSSPYAVFGTTSSAPLSLYHISPDGFSPFPISLRARKDRPSAVYGITCAPPSSPLGPSEHVVISGWYDGLVHVYDLRVSRRSQGPQISGLTSALLPVLTLKDPWSPEPIYSVSSGGGDASFIAAGMARHGVVAFWDVRQPSQSWSVHAPGSDSSPVYSIILESSRLFGVTQSRSFVYDFGPGVTKDTYPPITHIGPSTFISRRGISEERLQLERNGVGYHVAKYSHLHGRIF